MNDGERGDVEHLLPMANRIAARWGSDEELVSVAHFALCKAVVAYSLPRTSCVSMCLKTFCWRKVNQACRRYRRRAKRHITNLDMAAVPDREENTILFDVLPPELRQIAQLAWVEKLGVRGIAKRVGIPRRLIVRALAEAKSLIQESL